MPSHPVSLCAKFKIGVVYPRDKAKSPAVIFDLASPYTNQGTDYSVALGGNTCQPLKTSATEKREEKCLYVIICVVSGRNSLRPHPVKNSVQKCISKLTRPRFHPSLPFAPTSLRHTIHHTRNVSLFAKIVDAFCIPIRFFPAQTVIEECGGHANTPIRAVFPKEMKK